MRLSALSLSLGIVLTGCGGGSDSAPTATSVGGSVASTTTQTHVSFDNSNYVLASTEAASSSLFMMDAPSTVLGVDSTDANTLIQFGLAQVPSLESWLKNPSVATGVVQSQVVNCPVSGTLTAVVSDADNNGVLSVNDSVSITANNCKENTTATMNGSITFTVLALSGNLDSNFYNASLKLTYNNLSAVTSASSLVGNGDITLSASANGVNVRSQSVGSTSFTANATYGATSYSRSLSNFNSTQTMASNTPVSAYKVTSNVSGTVASSALGNLKVDMSTTVPFVRKSTDAFPSSGQVSLTGASAAKVRLTAQSANSVLIELDANADGIYESSTTKPWTEMR